MFYAKSLLDHCLWGQKSSKIFAFGARRAITITGGGQPDFSDFSDPDFGKINFHIGKIGKQFFANISLPDHFRAYVDS